MSTLLVLATKKVTEKEFIKRAARRFDLGLMFLYSNFFLEEYAVYRHNLSILNISLEKKIRIEMYRTFCLVHINDIHSAAIAE